MSELLDNDRRPQGHALFWRTYMFSWVALSCGALSYLGSYALNPEGQSGPLAKPPQSQQESNRSELDRAQLAAQVRTLSSTVASLRNDLERYRELQADPATARALASDAKASDSKVSDAKASNAETEIKTTAAQPVFPTFEGTNPISTSSVNEKSQPIETPDNDPAESKPRAQEVQRPSQPVFTAAVPPQDQPQIVNQARATQPAEKPALTPAPVRRGRNMATTPLRAGNAPPLPEFLPRETAGTRVPPSTQQNPYQAALFNRDGTAGATSAAMLANAPSSDKSFNQPSHQYTGVQPRPLANAQQITTNSVVVASPKPLAPVFGAPKVRQNNVARAAALVLSSAASVTGLRASWLLLTTNQPDAFAGFTPRYVSDPTSGTYRLLAGPIVNHAEADRVCTQLRAQNIVCGVSDYTGSPL